MRVLRTPPFLLYEPTFWMLLKPRQSLFDRGSLSLSDDHASWEKGTAAEALIELNATSYSVFSKDAFPPPETLPTSQNASDVLKIVDEWVPSRHATHPGADCFIFHQRARRQTCDIQATR